MRVRTRRWCVLALTILVPLVLSSAGARAGSEEQTVYVTASGKKYHRSDCHYVRDGKTAVSLKDAVAMGLTACRSCWKGKVEKSEGSDSADERPRCTGTTQKGTRCKRKAAEGSRRCWQHK